MLRGDEPIHFSGQVDQTEAGKKGVALGVYSLEGDELKLALAEPGDTERPTVLASKKEAKHIFVTLKRKVSVAPLAPAPRPKL